MRNALEIRQAALAIRARLMDENPDLARDLASINFKVSARMTRAAGYAQPSKRLVKLSEAFFLNPENDSQLENTVTHEIAHILAPPTRSPYARKRDVHGHEWQRMHRRLGGTAERCHDMALAEGFQRRTRTRAQRVDVPCGKCGQPVALGPTQLKRARLRGAVYSHKRCPR